MSKLTILRGISGSGKSTWARSQVGAVVVSRDDLRLSLFGSNGPDYYLAPKATLYARENLVTSVEHATIAAALKAGSDVVSDNTNVRMTFVNKIAAIGYEHDAEVVLKVIDVTLGEALKRVAHRAEQGGRPVEESIVRSQYVQLGRSINARLTPPPALRPYTGTPGKLSAIIVDIDGTIARMVNRLPYDWHKVLDDEPIKHVVDLLNELYVSDYRIVLLSGRDGEAWSDTISWLKNHKVPYDRIFMRAKGDMRRDSIVKAELFDNHVRDHYDVKFVLDDRDQVVKMWRKMGIPCFQVAEGDF